VDECKQCGNALDPNGYCPHCQPDRRARATRPSRQRRRARRRRKFEWPSSEAIAKQELVDDFNRRYPIGFPVHVRFVEGEIGFQGVVSRPALVVAGLPVVWVGIGAALIDDEKCYRLDRVIPTVRRVPAVAARNTVAAAPLVRVPRRVAASVILLSLLLFARPAQSAAPLVTGSLAIPAASDHLCAASGLKRGTTHLALFERTAEEPARLVGGQVRPLQTRNFFRPFGKAFVASMRFLGGASLVAAGS
jgi:hypothetical protein